MISSSHRGMTSCSPLKRNEVSEKHFPYTIKLEEKDKHKTKMKQLTGKSFNREDGRHKFLQNFVNFNRLNGVIFQKLRPFKRYII
jgi:hypothetical protein